MDGTERRTQKRRSEDASQCESCADLAERVLRLEQEREADMVLNKQALDALLEEVRAIRAQNETQLEIMTAWNSAKGFVKGMQLIGSVTKWIAGVVAAIGALWAVIHYGRGD